MKFRPRLALVLAASLAGAAAAVTVPVAPAAAAVTTPVILNDAAQNGPDTQWAETQQLPNQSGVRTFYATFLVQQPVGRTITGVRADVDQNGVDNTSTIATTTIASLGGVSQTLAINGGGLETSRVTVPIPVGNGTGIDCPAFGTTHRSSDKTVSIRVVDNTGVTSGSVTSTLRFVGGGEGNCISVTGSSADFPRLTSASQNLTEVIPGQQITYTYSCDDVDGDTPIVGSSDDECASADVRWRRLDDGSTGSLGSKTGTDDNIINTFNASFPSQGYYVVEAQFKNANGTAPNIGGTTQGYWRLGNAVVNNAASSLSGSIDFSGASLSTPPSVNPNAVTNAVATTADTGGAVQAIEWDGNGDSIFSGSGPDTSAYTVPTKTGGDIVHPALSTAQLQKAMTTSTAGLFTVNARITDNGALDGADSIRRQLTFTGQLRVNAIPTASNVSATTAEDNATTITLGGVDTDNQPDPLTRSIVANPTHGTLDAVSGNQVTYTPNANFNGTDTFTYKASDGNASTVGVHADSNIATVTVTVTPVNDVPVIDPHAATTNEDTSVTIHATGTDVENDNLDYSVSTAPSHGAAVCNSADNCTYTPALDFNGTDSFVVTGTDQGTDGPAQSSTATFTITVNAINDAPVPLSETINVPEDSANFPINLHATDVDSVVLTFNAPVDDIDNGGTLSCLGGDSCIYSPAADFNGTDAFTFTVTDGALTSTGTITLNVTAVNDAPIATDQEITTDEDVAITTTLGGTDVDNDPLSVLSLSDPPHGTATQAGPGANDATYLGDANFNGIDTFDFTLGDGALTDTGHVTVTVNPVNDAPVINDQTFSAIEDTPGILSMSASDVDGDRLTWSIVSGPSSALLLGSGPDVAYVPHHNVNGTDTYIVKVTDTGGLSDTATITVSVAPVNDQPEAFARSVTTNEDNPTSFLLDAFDVDGDVLTYAAPNIGPFNGGVTCTNNACTYTPTADFHGSDLITFSVDDGHGGTDSASVSITVSSVNDAPVASPDSATLAEDTTQPFALAATDIDHDLLTYTTTAPSHGTLIGIAPNVVYVPNANYFGPDGFSFTADDGNGSQSSANIALVVTSVNDAPVAIGGTVTTNEDQATTFQLGGVDVEGDALTYSVTSPASVGMLSCSTSGACSYTPAANDSGTYEVGYVVSDGSLTDNGVFTILVAPVNDPPVPANSTVATSEDTALPITLAATDTEGDPLNYAIASPPSHGTLTCTTDSCVYTPAPNYNGSDSFVWQVDDGNTSAITATVSILVSAVNDAPEALDTSTTTDEEAPVTFNLLATDVDGDALTYAIDTTTTHGTLSVNPTTGVATYTPAVDFNGTDTFLFKTTDPSGAFSLGHGTITVIGLPLIVTRLVGEPTTAQVLVKLGQPVTSANVVVLNNMRATLTGWFTKLPVAGRTITFTVDGTFVCSAVTNAQGVGNCGNSVTGIATVLGGGYRVSFGGDGDYTATTAGGPFTIQLKVK